MTSQKKLTFQTPDVTVEELTNALYRSNLALDRTNKELLRLQKEQSDLFTNLTHDLRSPISAIRVAIEYMLSDSSLTLTEIRDSLGMLLTRTEFLEQLIHDILLLSTVESMGHPLHLECIDIGIFLEELFYNYREDSNYANRKLILEVPSNFPYQVMIDTKLLHRVFDNLFSNALKFSTSGASITLIASISESYVIITVKDTGIGISKEHLPHIFDRSFMVSDSRTPTATTGYGLGLSIVKAIVSRLGGTISCNSTLHVGSSFSLTLPVFMNTEEA